MESAHDDDVGQPQDGSQGTERDEAMSDDTTYVATLARPSTGTLGQVRPPADRPGAGSGNGPGRNSPDATGSTGNPAFPDPTPEPAEVEAGPSADRSIAEPEIPDETGDPDEPRDTNDTDDTVMPARPATARVDAVDAEPAASAVMASSPVTWPWPGLDDSPLGIAALRMGARGDVKRLRTHLATHGLLPDSDDGEHAGGGLDSGSTGTEDTVRAAILLAWALSHVDAAYVARVELDRVAALLDGQRSVVRGLYHAVAAEVASHQGNDEQATEHALQTLIELKTEADSTSDNGRPPAALPGHERVDDTAMAEAVTVARALASCALTLTGLQLFPLAAEAGEAAASVANQSGLSTTYPTLVRACNAAAFGLRLDHAGLTAQAHEQWSMAVALHESVLADRAAMPRTMRGYAEAVRAIIATRFGALSEAERWIELATASIAPLRTTKPAHQLHSLLTLAHCGLMVARGELADSRAQLRQQWLSGRTEPAAPWNDDVLWLLATAAERAGDLADALRWTRELHTRSGRGHVHAGIAQADAARLRIESAGLQRSAERWQSSALTDALTGIPNRRALDEALPRRVHDAAFTGRPLTLVLLDIDGFKQVNDVHGHEIGDEVLRRIAHLVRSHCRDIDWCARYGGDEIVLLLQASCSESFGVLERLRSTVESHPWQDVFPALSPPRVSVTAGVAEHRSGVDVSTLFRTADAHLLEEKRRRKSMRAMPPAQPAGPQPQPLTAAAVIGGPDAKPVGGQNPAWYDVPWPRESERVRLLRLAAR